MDLPVELRLMISARTLGPYLYPLRKFDNVHHNLRAMGLRTSEAE